MPEKNYGVVKAHPIEGLPGTSSDSHYEIHVVDANNTHYRIAVNVLSQDQPSALMYYLNPDFSYPTAGQQNQLSALPSGFTPLPNEPGGLAFDYQRGGFFTLDQIAQLFTVEAENKLNGLLASQIQQAISDPNAFVCAFGSHWYEPTRADQNFGFLPGNGIHDIHMNQGNNADFASDDGTWQDGALLIYQPSTQQWMAVFLMFQSQQLPTDDQGHRLS